MTPPPLFGGRRRAWFIGLLALVFVQAAALAGAAVATRVVFAALHIGGGVPSVLLMGLALAGTTTAFAQMAFRILAERLGQDFAAEVRLVLFDHASRSAQSTLDRRRFGYQLLRFTGDLSALKDWPGLGLPRLVQAAILLPAACVVLWTLHPAFAGLGFGIMIAVATGLGLGFGKLKTAHATLRRRRAKLSADMAERLPVAPGIAAMGRRAKEKHRLQKHATRVAGAAVTMRRWSEAFKLMPEALTVFAACGILWIVAQNALPVSTAAAALAALGLTARPLSHVASSLNKAAAFRVAHAKLRAALARPLAASMPASNTLAQKPIRLDLRIPEYGAVFVNHGQQITLPPSLIERLAPVLSGAEPPGDWTVRLNDKEISTLSPGSLRRRIAQVSPNPLILKSSMRKNLTLGLRHRPDDRDVLRTLEEAGLSKTLSDLGGLDRRLAERGAALNPDQRTALCLMRIALQRPSLIILRSGVQTTLPPELRRRATIVEPPGLIKCSSLPMRSDHVV